MNARNLSEPITPATIFALALAAADELADADRQSIVALIAARQAYAGLFDAALARKASLLASVANAMAGPWDPDLG